MPFFYSDGNFADAVFRFNANISYSGVLHAVTQDVSASEPFDLSSSPGLTLGSVFFIFLFRVFSLRTKRSSSTMPFWHFCPRRLNCLHLMLSWRVISRLFDGWWPRRLASRLLPSYPSKNAAVICVHLALIFSRLSCWLTAMLCHSKVWSRVWRHRCNVNMNPYISVSPSACFSFFDCKLFPKYILSCLSGLCLPSVFITGFSKSISDRQAVCLNCLTFLFVFFLCFPLCPASCFIHSALYA